MIGLSYNLKAAPSIIILSGSLPGLEAAAAGIAAAIVITAGITAAGIAATIIITAGIAIVIAVIAAAVAIGIADAAKWEAPAEQT